MRRTWMLLGGLLVAVGLLAGPAEGRLYEIDYATYDVTVTDTKGVVTQAEDFGFNTGPNILVARRGDAYVEIPFRKIRTIEVGAYIPEKRHSPCTVTSRRGGRYQLQLERLEGQRFMTGQTELGSLRIRLGQCARLDLHGFTGTESTRD